MNLEIKIRMLNDSLPQPEVIAKGEWVDLRASKTVNFGLPFEDNLIPLGVAMKLPEGYEAVIVPRSSIYKNFGVILANSFGVVDNSYSGNYDEWGFHAINVKSNTQIKEGDRICQFRIQLSQKATFKQKLKWLLCSGIRLNYVNSLDSNNRGGFGGTGKN